MKIGYARVSTEDQNLDMQIDALTRAGCTKIFAEKVSGAKFDRPQYLKLKEYARDGEDTIVVCKLDRLGRSLKHLIEEVNEFEARNIAFVSLAESIDTTSPGGKLFFHIFAAVAEFERDLIKERTIAGLAAARARGRLGGRPKKITTAQANMLKSLYKDAGNNIKDLCHMFGISKSTLFRIARG